MASMTGELAALAAEFARAATEAEQAAGQAVRKAGTDVMAQAQTRAPVDTGYLRSSISADSIGPTEVEIGPTAHYGKYLEYGTSRAAAQPYLQPAFDAVAPSLENAISQIGGRIL